MRPADVIDCAAALRARGEPPCVLLHVERVLRRTGLLRRWREHEEVRGVLARGWPLAVDTRPIPMASSVDTVSVNHASGLLLGEGGRCFSFTTTDGPSDLSELRVRRPAPDLEHWTPNASYLTDDPPPAPEGADAVGPLHLGRLCAYGCHQPGGYIFRQIRPPELRDALARLASGGGPHLSTT